MVRECLIVQKAKKNIVAEEEEGIRGGHCTPTRCAPKSNPMLSLPFR